jgi:hypothetical protein
MRSLNAKFSLGERESETFGLLGSSPSAIVVIEVNIELK